MPQRGMHRAYLKYYLKVFMTMAVEKILSSLPVVVKSA
jgi:hypothetical protein